MKNTKLLIGMPIAIILILGIITGIFYLLDDSPFNDAIIKETIDGTLGEEFTEAPEEMGDEFGVNETINSDETKTIEVDGLGKFTIDSNQGILIIQDKSSSVSKSVTVEGTKISFSNGYFAQIVTAGTYSINVIPNDENSYKGYSDTLLVNAGEVNDGSNSAYIVELEEIMSEPNNDDETVIEGSPDESEDGVVGDVIGDEKADEVDKTTDFDTDKTTEDSSVDSSDTRAVTVKVVNDDGRTVSGIRVKIGENIYRTTNEYGETNEVELSKSSSYWINVYGDDEYRTKSILLMSGDNDITKTIEVEPVSGIPDGFVEFRVRAYSTVGDVSSSSQGTSRTTQVLEDAHIFFRTSGNCIYDADAGEKVSYVQFMTDSDGYSPDNRFYVKETGCEVEIDTQSSLFAYGEDRTLSSSTDKGKYSAWRIDYCPKEIRVTFEAYHASGKTSSDSSYEWWLIGIDDYELSDPYGTFNRASMWLAALWGENVDADAKVEYSTDGSNWKYAASLNDPYTSFVHIPVTLDDRTGNKMYVKINYDNAGDAYSDIRLWEFSADNEAKLDIKYKGLQD